MKELQELFMIFGVLSTWYLFGVAVMKTIVYRDEYWHGDRVVTYAFAIGWPVLGLITLLHRIGRQTFPWIKRKWKAFRAPKVEKKKEKAAAKIRMCPALKLKKYEQLLTEIETMHNRYYYHYIHDQVTEFARIRGGKPEVKAVLEVRPEGQAAVYFGRYNGFVFGDVQAMAPVVEAVEERVAREEGPDMYVR